MYIDRIYRANYAENMALKVTVKILSKLLSTHWVQLLISELVLCLIIIGSAFFTDFEIISRRSLQILIGGFLLSAIIIGIARLSRLKTFSQGWAHILIGGIVLSAITMEVIRETGNLYFVPAAALLSAFVVPLAAVTYLYQHIQHRNISIPLLMACFFVGGSLGFIASGFVEYAEPQGWTVMGLLGSGIAEESAKLIFPAVLFIRWQYKHEADGLLFGAAVGMGFAALETMGYALTAFTESSGNLGSFQWVLLYRGLLSPAAHAAWTGFICAMVWRQRERTRLWAGPSTIGAFLIAVVLHAMWNIIAYNFALTGIQAPIQMAISAIEFLIVASIGLSLILWRFKKSRNTNDDIMYNMYRDI